MSFAYILMLTIGGLFSSKVDDFDRMVVDKGLSYPDADLCLSTKTERGSQFTQCFFWIIFLSLCLSEGELVITSKMIVKVI